MLNIKTILIILLIIFSSNLFSAEKDATQSEINNLKKREEALRKKEEALKKKEQELNKKEKIYDKTGYEQEMRKREAARRERERLRKLRKKKYGGNPYQENNFVTAFGGISYNILANDLNDTEKTKLGLIFGAEYLTVTDKDKQIKAGVHLSYAHSLIKIDGPKGEMQTNGIFLLVFGQYEFIKRKDGNNFIPFANLYLGLLFPIQSNSQEQINTVSVSAGLGAGFTYWIKPTIGITLKLKILASKFYSYPQSYDDESQFNLFLVPTLGVSFAF